MAELVERVGREAPGPAGRGADRAAERPADRRVLAGRELVSGVEAGAEGLAGLAAGARRGVAGWTAWVKS